MANRVADPDILTTDASDPENHLGATWGKYITVSRPSYVVDIDLSTWLP